MPLIKTMSQTLKQDKEKFKVPKSVPYELEEKLLGLLMFTSDYRKEGEKILED